MTPEQKQAWIGTRRPVKAVKRGWHVQQSDGRWRLVEVATPTRHGTVILAFADNPGELAVYGNTLNTRTPAEQIIAVFVEERQRARRLRRAFRERQQAKLTWFGIPTALALME